MGEKKEKTTYRMGENSCKWGNQQGLNLQNIQTTQTAQQQQQQKKKESDRKMGRRYKETFLQRRHTDGQQAHEKIFNITNY